MTANLGRFDDDRWRKVVGWGILIAAILVARPREAAAGMILDQEYAPMPPTLEAHNGLLSRAQTFIAGKTGKLVLVEALMGGIGSSTFEIWPTNGSQPFPIPTTPLFSGTLTFSTGSTQIRDFEPLDVSSANIQVQPGDVLAIVQIGSSHTGNGSWFGVGGNPFARGTGFTTISTAPTGPWNDLDWDLGFRTYIEAIPEPSSLVIAVLAFLPPLAGRRAKK